jgi:hypothetical protein
MSVTLGTCSCNLHGAFLQHMRYRGHDDLLTAWLLLKRLITGMNQCVTVHGRLIPDLYFLYFTVRTMKSAVVDVASLRLCSDQRPNTCRTQCEREPSHLCAYVGGLHCDNTLNIFYTTNPLLLAYKGVII